MSTGLLICPPRQADFICCGRATRRADLAEPSAQAVQEDRGPDAVADPDPRQRPGGDAA